MRSATRTVCVLILLFIILAPLTTGPWHNVEAQSESPPLPDIQRYRIETANNVTTQQLTTDIAVTIDHIGPDYIDILAASSERDALLAQGFDIQLSPRPLIFSQVDQTYQTYDEMVANIQQVAQTYPAIVQLSSIGTSYEGRPLWMAKISDNVTTDEAEPEALFIGQYHAREILTVEMMLYLLDMFTREYDPTTPDNEITQLVNTREIYLLFSVNPDGGVHDIASGIYQYWRKNRQPNEGFGCIGTDPNRNHSYRWGGTGASVSPCDNTYRGTGPASTPEITAVQNFVNSRMVSGRQQIEVAISFHTYGELILWPYGYQSGTACGTPITDMPADDLAVLQTMGEAMAATNGYTPQQSCKLYTTSGDFVDWAYGAHRIFAYTFEMHPCFTTGCPGYGFYPPGSVIATETARNRKAILYLLQQADCPYATIDKPDRCNASSADDEWQLWLPIIQKA
ncbi:MAG: Carboxypeptidase T [Chloroflexi bacterium AL-W]|nr:Carboxypeptidase T [Chloroflexi bacterium AL-N1]NOK66669.1 Carboxypeptidase T [Chloroflexi bacterium AL-N10]NOK72057.1 Carboxypeptidase T [Chloroflexi bacterium AL-N5]NOK81314.1 Carboxypeptidase T [Chloroflexi bacterium AL-W]NOK89587.1 Carboxypeptidase T [Chloroflexi bacterium AL-N15]